MVKITVSVDCGNSPRKLFLKDLNIALAQGDTAFVVEHVDDEILWEIVGDKSISGKAEFEKALKRMVDNGFDELVLRMVITHGKDAAAYGERTMKNGKRYAFSDGYTFRGAQGNTIKSITSFLIEVQ